MALRTLSAIPGFADSIFADRVNRIDRLFSQLAGDSPIASLPAYDLKKVDDNNYLLRVSVPGWKEDELEIETVSGNLHVSGKQTENESQDESGWIYRGIRRSDFRLSFSLPEHAKVSNAKLESGFLQVSIYQEIPESEKPRKIAIENSSKVIEHQA
ncbi:Hsp20 family protein [Candidatus Symbiopectobacterium sp. NZEC135]|uniref:Hsp20 family protein n=1 Tax=Candidatus Symbiopectobacterium sp. NZEC135 TaxID=2820471 RepID=UPI0022276198|nr:Hsp20 family protein [Candidatus Symbiopectobacterium sp. NZEC135]MCW2477663.1 Hsp20 family protein [Candidatus Symbiopectobacterium sp. NZEC135]